MVDTHVVQVQQMPSAQADPHSSWARWVCTCGRRSKLFGYPGLAENAGANHERDANRQPMTRGEPGCASK